MKKGYYSFLQNFQTIINLDALKLALNKSMRASEDEQGMNKLWPKDKELGKTFVRITNSISLQLVE